MKPSRWPLGTGLSFANGKSRKLTVKYTRAHTAVLTSMSLSESVCRNCKYMPFELPFAGAMLMYFLSVLSMMLACKDRGGSDQFMANMDLP